MLTFKKEIEAILAQLMGSPWAAHPEVQDVIAEYQHFLGAAKTPTQTRRVSLQIFHASRAIDSFLDLSPGHLRPPFLFSGRRGRSPE